MQKGAISAQLPRESTADLLGICQQVPQINTSSLPEEEILLRNGAGHQEAYAAPSGGQLSTAVHPRGVASQALFERWPQCSALSSRDSAFPSHLLN